MSTLPTSLSQSFQNVPATAVPAMLDCILASTDDSAASLFDSLLPQFSNLIKEFLDDDKKMSSEDRAYLVSYMRGLCHLLKNLGVDAVALESFIWEAFIPLMKIADREILHESVQSLLEVVRETKCWHMIEQTLNPYLLRSVALSMDVTQSEEIFVIRLSGQYVFLSFKELSKHDKFFEKIPLLPLTILCYILSCLLEAANEICQPVKGYSNSTDVFCADKFGGHLLWNLCNLTLQMLSQSIEHRSCSVSILLHSILKSFTVKQCFEVCIQGISCNISRQHFFMKLWKCSRILFALGSAERKDAYGIILLYLSFFPCVDGSQVEMADKAAEFDIRAEKEFWAEMKRGLVEKEGLMRKQSLHILKKVIFLNEGGSTSPNYSDEKPHYKAPPGMTKRDRWAEEEAQSLGVGKICISVDSYATQKQKWEAFMLLYEMLEEYGTHLVEAAWNHQIMLLLQSSISHNSPVDLRTSVKEIDLLGGNFDWLAILWERGLFHDNPHVRCHIMKSFLEVEWKRLDNCREMFSEDFILGAFMQGLSDPVHHKDFGSKGVHSSRTIEAASKFLHQYCMFFNRRERSSFMCKLALVAKLQSLSRVGLMSLSECIVSICESANETAAQGHIDGIIESEKIENAAADANGVEPPRTEPYPEYASLVDSLRFLVEISKQHFNPNYRLRVCENMIEAAASVAFAHELPLQTLLHFIGALPREFTDRSGSLIIKLQKWLVGNYEQNKVAYNFACGVHTLHNLYDFPCRFTCHYLSSAKVRVSFDDDDLVAWFSEAERWARVLFLSVEDICHMEPILEFIKNKGVNICEESKMEECLPTKFFVLLLSLVQELEFMQQRTDAEAKTESRSDSEVDLCKTARKIGLISEKFAEVFLIILENLRSFAEVSCSIFWTDAGLDFELPGSVTGKLGGPSQRRLSSSMTTTVLQAIVSMRALAAVSSWCALQSIAGSFNFTFSCLWKFFQEVVSLAPGDSETSAEIQLAAYEASSFVLKASVRVISTSVLSSIQETNNSSDSKAPDEPVLDSLVLTFLNRINGFLAFPQLARTRRAILMNWKWLCLEAILSIPYHAQKNGVELGHGASFFSDYSIRLIFADLVESLENAGENSVLPMLRSVRMVLDLLTSASLFLSSCHGVDVQMMWQLVRSAWILHTSCNKRRVAPIAALLSSVMHVSVFRDDDMHVTDKKPGPLKWFCEKILEEGTKSPRTIRLAALHLTGLWLSNPRILQYYMKELKLLTLYGSVAFDEDFEAELTENVDAKSELLLLAKVSDNELTEAYINTELYARVSVAVLFYKLADLAEMVGSAEETIDCCDALESGKLFLLELLDSAVNDKDIAKELYKKYSATHRRKVRAWQMICILSRFVRQDIVQGVLDCLSTSLYRNNFPGVRQYLETFAIHLYLNYPFLVQEHLVPILCDYDMKTQALSSYVFIAANIMLHAKAEVQSKHLAELLPPIIPLLTSHHHTLRGFTQLLVYQVFCKLLPEFDSKTGLVNLEEKCFYNLKTYLAQNPDCRRLRASMEGYLDAFNPDQSVTPAGIFSNRVEDLEFECVSTSLMEQVMNFLNGVREELRNSMAKDDVTLKNESLMKTADPDSMRSNASQELSLVSPSSELSLDFQKKIMLSKHDALQNVMEREDQLLEQILHSRISSAEEAKASRQQIILVASLLDRIPNLAGLARTCEVFKASALVVADVNVLQDKQFQLISVTAEKWVPIIEVPVNSIKTYLEKKKQEGFSILGLEQTANSMPLDKYSYPQKTVIVLGREKEGIPADIIHVLDGCIEIPQLGVVRSLNVHVSGAIAIWEYTRQQRSKLV